MKVSERIYRWLLRLYPRDFRDEYGEEMSLLFRHRAADGSFRLWLQVLGDLLFHAPREHWNILKQDLRYAIRTLLRERVFAQPLSSPSPWVSAPTLPSSAPSTPFSYATFLSRIRIPSWRSTQHPAINSTRALPIRTISICGIVEYSRRWQPLPKCPSRWMRMAGRNLLRDNW